MFQRVTLIGRVGQDPEMRYTPDETPVTNFSVATTSKLGKKSFSGDDRPCPEGWKDGYQGKYWELTTWWRVTCWRSLAETVNTYVTKGMQVFVEGEVRGDASDGAQNPRVWQANTGEYRASYELTARKVLFLGSSGEARPIGEPPPEGFEENDLPPF